jgi:hypothetical protein
VLLLLLLLAAISDAAAGGQVLCDEASFAAVRAELRRLGAVTAQGVDFGQLSSSRRSRLQGCCRRLRWAAPVRMVTWFSAFNVCVLLNSRLHVGS